MPSQKRFGEKGGTEAIEVALNPEELDMDTAAMQAKYEQTMREQQSQLEKEDLTDMVAEHAAKQKVQNHFFFFFSLGNTISYLCIIYIPLDFKILDNYSLHRHFRICSS